jgi:hypothetical protein
MQIDKTSFNIFHLSYGRRILYISQAEFYQDAWQQRMAEEIFQNRMMT